MKGEDRGSVYKNLLSNSEDFHEIAIDYLWFYLSKPDLDNFLVACNRLRGKIEK